jgi:hypothetical protein
MQRKFRVIPCLESEYTNGYVVVEVLLFEHEYAIPENEILILDNDNIGLGDIVSSDGTILKDLPDLTTGEKTEEELKQQTISDLEGQIESQNTLITFYQNVVTKSTEKIAAINANTPNITFGSEAIRNAPDNAARLVLLNAAIVDAQNKITQEQATLNEIQGRLSALES